MSSEEKKDQTRAKGESQSEKHDSMGKRGVTRPQMMHDNGDGKQNSNMKMSEEDRREMLEKHHEQILWIPFLVVMLGVWLTVAPFTFGYQSSLLIWSDVLSGAALILFGFIWSRTPHHPTVVWAACFVGIWLQFAPLVFWAPTTAAYLNDTLVGVFIIALTILIPGMPAMITYMKMGPDVPPGWSYTPSSWAQRFPLAALGFAGWLISRYLAAYQLGYIDTVFDPFFHEGTRLVLTSDVSKSIPVSDAGLGAFAYTFETLMAFMGGRNRWRTMPWMVLFFGILVIPLGLVHIILVILQPVVVGQWCTFCLAAAFMMLLMIPLSVDEVVAMCQFFYKKVWKDGEPFWRTFWKGGTIEGGEKDERSPLVKESFGKVFSAMVWGVTFPWTLAASAALGVWLMFAPWALNSTGRMADSDHLVGALIVTISFIVTAEVIRAGRFINMLFGAWLLVAPWVLSGGNWSVTLSDMLIGAFVIALSIPRGSIREQYGSWQEYIF